MPEGANLWVKNAAQESALVAEMRKGKTLVVKATSKKGNLTTDTYSLSDFAQAIDRALRTARRLSWRRDCWSPPARSASS